MIHLLFANRDSGRTAMTSKTRRRFLATLAAAGAWPLAGRLARAAVGDAPEGGPVAEDEPSPGGKAGETSPDPNARRGGPVAVSTWSHGAGCLAVAGPMLAAGASALDAGEKGVNVVELDPGNSSVGVGGLPNEAGVVQLDAAVMTGTPHGYGAVAGIEGIATPCSVARLVMERTRHCLLVGEGAKSFARDHGFEERSLLTDEARERWLEWRSRRAADDNWLPPEDNHDTIGYLGLDGKGRVAAVVSTSGLAWKIPGRVGDSPVAAAGLFADSDVGAACATGVGEEVLRTAGSAVIVELMRQGAHPQEAVEEALRRILRKSPVAARDRDVQACYLAINVKGEIGAAALSDASEFDFAWWRGGMDAPAMTVGRAIPR
jgi:N4-(beta-N-acetylglucosaminyl)-L-asparaginase